MASHLFIQAATGIADMCALQMQHEGTTAKDAYKRIFLINSKGLITVNSPVIKPEHQKYAKEMPHIKDLLEVSLLVPVKNLIKLSKLFTCSSKWCYFR